MVNDRISLTKCNERIKETAAVAYISSSQILLPIDKMLILIESIGHFLFCSVSKSCVIDLRKKMKHENRRRGLNDDEICILLTGL